jgi:hypothetical protein
MATVNYSDIVKRYSKIEDGFGELERILGRVPTLSESASLTGAYVNMSNIDKTTTSRTINQTGNLLTRAIATQEQTGVMPTEIIKISEATKEMFTFLNGIKSPLDLLTGGFKLLANQAELYLTQQSELLSIINKKAGLTGKFSKDLREELTNANIPLVRLGIDFAELATAQETLISSTGRFVGLNRETWAEAGAAASAYVGTLSQLVAMYPQFEKVGIGASNVAKEIEITGNRTISLGLQAQKVISELNTNLGRINQYGFKAGVQGMAEMVRKSTEFRMNMSEVFTLADNVFDPDKAISLSANLQAIGGAIGDFNDPLKLMYMATNDVEGLQDALIGVAGSLATYNEEQGRFEITGVNLRRAKALAAELGVEYKELANGAIAAAERSSAATAMMASGLDLDDDTKRFLTNISTMKDGQMTIELQGNAMREAFGANEILLEKLTEKQLTKLKEYQEELKELSSEDIVRQQATSVKNLERDVNFLLAIARVSAADKGDKFLSKLKNMFGYEPNKLIETSRKLADSAATMMGVKVFNDLQTTKLNTTQSVPTSVTQLQSVQSLEVNNVTPQTQQNNVTEKDFSSVRTLNVQHSIKESSVISDGVKRMWEEQLKNKDPREYTSQSV